MPYKKIKNPKHVKNVEKYRKLIKLINFPYSPVWSYSLLAGSEALP